MKVNVVNNLMEKLNVVVSGDDKEIKIIIEDLKNKVQLSTLKKYEHFFDVDGEEWVITEIHDGFVGITKNNLLEKTMEFGESNNYAESDRREYLNTEYLKIIERKFGKENLLEHEVDLISMDGFKTYGSVKDKISLRTFDQYREATPYLDLVSGTEWLATPNQTTERGDSSYVQCVGSGGDVDCSNCRWGSLGARPFLTLKSSIFVSLRKPTE